MIEGLAPAAVSPAPDGVSGGVHRGTLPGTCPDAAAAIFPIADREGVACMRTFASPEAEGCTKDDATDETDIDRAGLAGLTGANLDGEAGKLPVPCSEGRFIIGGAVAFTGVALGVVC